MIRDSLLNFDSAFAMPNGASASSTNTIPLGILGKVYAGQNMCLVMIWTGTPVGTSLKIDLRSSASSTDMNSTPSVHWSSGIIPQASYATNGFGSGLTPTVILLPMGYYNPNLAASTNPTGPYKAFLGLYYTAVGDASAGLLTAELVPVADIHRYAPSGYTLS